MSKNYLWFIFGVAATVGIVAITFFIIKPDDASSPADTGDTEEARNLEEADPIEDIIELSEPVSGVLLPEDWDRAEQTTEDLNEALEDGQALGWIVPVEELDIYYFTTTSETDDGTLLSVYEYNVEDYSFNRVYKRILTEDTFSYTEGLANVNVVAFDAGKLILLVQPASDSPGPCAEPLLLSDESTIRELVSLSISEPQDGLTPYILSKELRESAEARTESCLEENDLLN